MVIRIETVSSPPRCTESTWWTCAAIGFATSGGQALKIRSATRSARPASPMKAASVPTKITKGKTAISADRATWLDMAQPSSSLK